MTTMKALLPFAVTALLTGACASAPAPVQTAPATPAVAEPLPNDVHWVRTAAEHRAIFIQTYRAATRRLHDLAHGREPGSWGVILDADETVLDNSEYQRRLAARGARFDIESWNAWVREAAADSLPGAAAFIHAVHERGGHVAIVTNREDAVCDETRENLARLGMHVDVVLCQLPGERGKDARFARVAAGETDAGLPPLDVLVFIGDNIHDFPSATQDLRTAEPSALDRFGSTWFVLPNPMYGSWERNPPR